MPKDSTLHDVLVFPRVSDQRSKWYRVPVDKQPPPPKPPRGSFTKPPIEEEHAGLGTRRAETVARPHDVAPAGAAPRAVARGPAFATLPIKPEPAGAAGVTCYLLSADNFNVPNYWTVEEWNDQPGGVQFEPPKHKTEFQLLIAGPQGKVFQLHVANTSEWAPEDVETFANRRGSLRCVNLKREAETWSQLRNGCVAGRVHFQKTKQVLPLVNVTALGPEFECEAIEEKPAKG